MRVWKFVRDEPLRTEQIMLVMIWNSFKLLGVHEKYFIIHYPSDLFPSRHFSFTFTAVFCSFNSSSRRFSVKKLYYDTQEVPKNFKRHYFFLLSSSLLSLSLSLEESSLGTLSLLSSSSESEIIVFFFFLKINNEKAKFEKMYTRDIYFSVTVFFLFVKSSESELSISTVSGFSSDFISSSELSLLLPWKKINTFS